MKIAPEMESSLLEVPVRLALLALIFALGAFVQGITGFAFAMVTMALLPYLMTVKAATPLVAVVAFVNVTCILWQMRRSIDLGKTKGLLLGVLVGVPLGVAFLARLNETAVVRALAIVLIFAAVQGMLVKSTGGKALAPGWAPVAGLAGGAVGGAFNVGGAPIILYVYRQPWEKETIVAVLQTVFFISLSYRMGIFLCSGLLTKSLMLQGLLMTPFTVLGGWLGVRMQRKIDADRLKRIVNIMLLLLAFFLFLR